MLVLGATGGAAGGGNHGIPSWAYTAFFAVIVVVVVYQLMTRLPRGGTGPRVAWSPTHEPARVDAGNEAVAAKDAASGPTPPSFRRVDLQFAVAFHDFGRPRPSRASSKRATNR